MADAASGAAERSLPIVTTALLLSSLASLLGCSEKSRLIRAAEHGDASAQYKLGVMYQDGRGMPRDNAKAVQWFVKSAEQGDAKAQYNLGVNYFYGKDVPQDYAEAMRWFAKSAEQGDAEAQCNLGKMYYFGIGAPQDYAKAIEWYAKSAEQGFAEAKFNLGVMHRDGQGMPQDYAKAIEWFAKSAEQGDANAQYSLGLMYCNGEGTPQDYIKAKEWFTKSAEQDDAKAQHNLGAIYYYGRGVPQDYISAFKWFNLAAASGYEDAVNARDKIQRDMTAEQIAEGQKLSSQWIERQTKQAASPEDSREPAPSVNAGGSLRELLPTIKSRRLFGSEKQDGVTLAQFNRVQTGMSYRDVVAVLGRDGTVMSETVTPNFPSGEIRLLMYDWKGRGIPGANMTAMFQNGKMISKAQFWLE